VRLYEPDGYELSQGLLTRCVAESSPADDGAAQGKEGFVDVVAEISQRMRRRRNLCSNANAASATQR
jgi:hypothetical protein